MEKRKKKKKKNINYAIGIDLGTTYSCVAVLRDNQVEIIANDQGHRITPSKISFFNKDEINNHQYYVVGEAAANREKEYPEQSIFGIKRFIGRLYNESIIQNDLSLIPYNIVTNTDNSIKIKVSYNGETKLFTAEELSAMILLKMKHIAEDYLAQDINNIVLTVPAYFNDAQRQATKLAADIAGLNILRMINEPTAAALAYGLHRKQQEFQQQQQQQKEEEEELNKKYKKDHYILVYDLGGGTFDVSILAITCQGIFEVKATGGDTHLGGEDFDMILMNYYMKQYQRKYKVNDNVIYKKKSLKRLRYACERAKCTLSSINQCNIEIENFHQNIDFSCIITRARFEDLIRLKLSNTITTVNNVLKDANLQHDEINEIILVGGSTRIPKIKLLLKNLFPSSHINEHLNPDEAVAYGAAIQSSLLNKQQESSSNDLISSNNNNTNPIHEDLLLIDVTPLSLGMVVGGGVMNIFIKRNTPIPFQISKWQVSKQFKKLCIGYGIKGAVFHDCRRNALTDFMRKHGLNVPETMKIAGHTDPRMLLRIYNNLEAHHVAEKLNS